MRIAALKLSPPVAVLAVSGSLLAGSLYPAGPPVPIVVTLEPIYQRLGAPAKVASTGQTRCWDASGNPISCAGTGQDGELEKGVSVSPRFTDNRDGSVKDNLTGLTWLKNANCFGERNWADALTASNTLASGSCGLTDSSVAGVWRLPNVKELESLIDFGQEGPALPAGHPFTGVNSFFYCWSSTTYYHATYPSDSMYAWYVSIQDGFERLITKTDTGCVWPVRGGQ